MAEITRISNKYDQPSMDNLKNNFTHIKYYTDQILGKAKGACFSENPFVDIEALARNVGITEIRLVSSEEINGEHARLRGTVILVNKDDSPEEQHFSIAHEIFHFYLTEKDAARSVTNPQLEIWKSYVKNAEEMFIKLLAQAASKEFGKIVSWHIGKPISPKTEKIVYEKIGKAFLEIIIATMTKLNGKPVTKNMTLSNFKAMTRVINEVINETIEEEVADYFAANLVVPTERFLLWEDKTDEEIARAFGVPKECIKKRREEEIENELNFMTPENLSSDVDIEEAPASLDEWNVYIASYD